LGRKNFKGPRKFRPTGKRGFFLGLVLGGIAWYAQQGADPSLVSDLAGLRASLVVLSVVLLFIQYLRGKATLTPAGDGLAYGFTTAFDVLGWVSTGKIP